ncbi:Bifunctional protein HldE [Commensalibacter sp. Nvir]|nr:Bifunctional protein HldE [Commensalibacter sp. Nvir]
MKAGAMNFSHITILCIGDIMLDRYIYAQVQRISPEAPVPILKLTHTKEMVGGAGNVTNNILSLGGKVIIVGLVGEDSNAEKIKTLMEKQRISTHHLISSSQRPTICKSRFIAASQQVIRADEENLIALNQQEIKKILVHIDQTISLANAVIVSDYNKGMCHPTVIHYIIKKAKELDIPVFVDPKSKDFSLYKYATCITPNLKEAMAVIQRPLVIEKDFEQAGQQLLKITQGQAVLITRSEKGMTLIERDKPAMTIPSRAREIYDVSGAGDTVIAALSLSYASGYSFTEAVHIANAAAGVVVGKAGTSTATIKEVIAELQAQQEHSVHTVLSPELFSLNEVIEQINTWRNQNLKIGFTNGCFDILHPGHVDLLKIARDHCDRLIVALNTDKSVQLLKSAKRPINTLSNRAQIIAAVRYVDCVVSFDEETPFNLIAALKPDVLIKGADYFGKKVIGREIVEKNGGKVILADLKKGFSTTSIIDKIKCQCI